MLMYFVSILVAGALQLAWLHVVCQVMQSSHRSRCWLCFTILLFPSSPTPPCPTSKPSYECSCFRDRTLWIWIAESSSRIWKTFSSTSARSYLNNVCRIAAKFVLWSVFIGSNFAGAAFAWETYVYVATEVFHGKILPRLANT